MQIQSLGYRTDLFFPTFDGQIMDRGNYLVIRTPSNPTFYWGNFLLFPQPPGDGDLEVWRNLFAQEIGIPPDTEHQVFGWDSPDGELGVIQPFTEAGFRLDRNVVLTSRQPRNSNNSLDYVRIRSLKTEADWEQAVED